MTTNRTSTSPFRAIIFWGVYVQLLLIANLPSPPKSTLGWVVLFVLACFGLPAYIIMQATDKWMFPKERRGQLPEIVQWLLRIFCGVIVLISILAIAVWISSHTAK